MACHLEMGASPSIQDFGVGSARARSEEPVQERVESLIDARQQCIEAVKSPERLSTCGQSAGRSSERPSHLGELPAMGRGMRKSPSESALELSSSGDWDTIPAFQGASRAKGLFVIKERNRDLCLVQYNCAPRSLSFYRPPVK